MKFSPSTSLNRFIQDESIHCDTNESIQSKSELIHGFADESFQYETESILHGEDESIYHRDELIQSDWSYVFMANNVNKLFPTYLLTGRLETHNEHDK